MRRCSRLTGPSSCRSTGGQARRASTSLCYQEKGGKIDNPAGRPHTRVVVAPTGPSCVSSRFEAPDGARRRDGYTGLVPDSLLSLGGILGGGKRHPVPGKPAVKVACGTDPPPPRNESPYQENDPADAHPSAHKSVLESANPHGLGGCIWMHRVNGTGNSPSPGRPTPGVVKQDKSSGGSVDTTKTRLGPQRVRMSSGERPIGPAKGKQSDTEALCQTPPETKAPS